MQIEELRNKLKDKGYKLLDEIYENNKQKISIEKDGYKFYISWNCLNRTWNPKKWGDNNIYSIENLKLYLKNKNFKCKIISKEYNYNFIELLCECGNKYSCSVNNLLTKNQITCPTCSHQRGSNKQIKDKYIKFLENQNIELLEEYKGCRYYIYCKNKDNYYIRICPYNIYNGSNINDSIFDVKNKYTIENIKNYIKINKLEIELLSEEYKHSHSNLKLKCKCGNEFETSFYYFINNKKILCNKCSQKNSVKNKIKVNKEIFYENGLELIEEYKGISKRIYCKNEDGYYVYCSVDSLRIYENPNFTIFHICNKYIIDNIKRFIIINNLEIELISKEYNGSKEKLKFKCSCGNFYYNRLNDLKNEIGTKCKGCNTKINKSKMEEYLKKYLDINNIKNFREQLFLDCKDKYPLPFDFYLPDYNTCIECQGVQHFESIEFFGGEEHLLYTQKHDEIKRKFCKENNIKLIEISYIDFKNDKIEEIINKNINILN